MDCACKGDWEWSWWRVEEMGTGVRDVICLTVELMSEREGMGENHNLVRCCGVPAWRHSGREQAEGPLEIWGMNGHGNLGLRAVLPPWRRQCNLEMGCNRNVPEVFDLSLGS